MLHARLRRAREYRSQAVEDHGSGRTHFKMHKMWRKESGFKDAIGGEAHMWQVQRPIECVRSEILIC